MPETRGPLDKFLHHNSRPADGTSESQTASTLIASQPLTQTTRSFATESMAADSITTQTADPCIASDETLRKVCNSHHLPATGDRSKLSDLAQSVLNEESYQEYNKYGFSLQQLEILFGLDPTSKLDVENAASSSRSAYDRTEKASTFAASIKGPKCKICHDSRSFHDDPLICCVVCNMYVHQCCYGVSEEEVRWLMTGKLANTTAELAQQSFNQMEPRAVVPHLGATPTLLSENYYHCYKTAYSASQDNEPIDTAKKTAAYLSTSGTLPRMWYCDSCSFGESGDFARCCLCPNENGALIASDPNETDEVSRLLEKVGSHTSRGTTLGKRYRDHHLESNVSDSNEPSNGVHCQQLIAANAEQQTQSEKLASTGSAEAMYSTNEINVSDTSCKDHKISTPIDFSGLTLAELRAWAKTHAPNRTASCPKFWVHVLCAAYLPEPKFANYQSLGPVKNVSKIDAHRFQLRCTACGKHDGACMQCSFGACRAAFHPLCARNTGHCIRFEWTHGVSESPELGGRYIMYCPKDDPRRTKERCSRQHALRKEVERRRLRRRGSDMSISSKSSSDTNIDASWDTQHSDESDLLNDVVQQRRKDANALLRRLRRTSNMNKQSGNTIDMECSDSSDDELITFESSGDDSDDSVSSYRENEDSMEIMGKPWDGTVSSLVRYMVAKRTAAFDADTKRDQQRNSRSKSKLNVAQTSSSTVHDEVDESSGTMSLIIRPRVAADIWPAVSPYFIPVNTDSIKRSIRRALPARKFDPAGLPHVLTSTVKYEEHDIIVEPMREGVAGDNIIDSDSCRAPQQYKREPFYELGRSFFAANSEKVDKYNGPTLMNNEPKWRSGYTHDIVQLGNPPEGTAHNHETDLDYLGKDLDPKQFDQTHTSDSNSKTKSSTANAIMSEKSRLIQCEYERRRRMKADSLATAHPDVVEVMESIVQHLELAWHGVPPSTTSVHSTTLPSNQIVPKIPSVNCALDATSTVPLASLIRYELEARKAFALRNIEKSLTEFVPPRSLLVRLRLHKAAPAMTTTKNRRRKLALAGGGSPHTGFDLRALAFVRIVDPLLLGRLAQKLKEFQFRCVRTTKSIEMPVVLTDDALLSNNDVANEEPKTENTRTANSNAALSSRFEKYIAPLKDDVYKQALECAHYDSSDPAFAPPVPLGRHYTEKWAEQDAERGIVSTVYEGDASSPIESPSVQMMGNSGGLTRRAASRLSKGLSFDATEDNDSLVGATPRTPGDDFDASKPKNRNSKMLSQLKFEQPGSFWGSAADGSLTPKDANTVPPFLALELQNEQGAAARFSGWKTGDDFSHLRQSFTAQLAAYPPVQDLITVMHQEGVCSDTQFIFASPKPRQFRFGGVLVDVMDASILHTVNRVNPAFTCAGDFQASLETKNEFTMFAVRQGHVVAFINYYFMWYTQSHLPAGKRPPPQRVMYVATLQAVKRDSHPDLVDPKRWSGKQHPTRVSTNASTASFGSEPRTGTALFVLACQHARCVGIRAALCDSTPEAVPYYLDVVGSIPTTTSVEAARQRAEAIVKARLGNAATAVEEPETPSVNALQNSTGPQRLSQACSSDASSKPLSIKIEQNDGGDNHNQAINSSRDSKSGKFISRHASDATASSRAAVAHPSSSDAKYFPLYFTTKLEHLLKILRLNAEHFHAIQQERLQSSYGNADDNHQEDNQDDEVSDEIFALQQHLTRVMLHNDASCRRFYDTVEQELAKQVSHYKKTSYERRAWRTWKKDARRRAAEREKAMRQAEEDNDAVCAVCHGGDSNPGDQIVFCESCNLAVHQRCYGVASIPEDDWFCDVCAAAGGTSAAIHQHTPLHISCILCKHCRGAMKATSASEGRRGWVHVVCARLCGLILGPIAHVRQIVKRQILERSIAGQAITESFFKHMSLRISGSVCPIVVPATPQMAPIKGIWSSNNESWYNKCMLNQEHFVRTSSGLSSTKRCSVCGRSTGICLPCCSPWCQRWVHPSCALARGLIVAGKYANQEFEQAWSDLANAQIAQQQQTLVLRKATAPFKSTAPEQKCSDIAKALRQSSTECTPQAVEMLLQHGVEGLPTVPSADLDKAAKWNYANHKDAFEAVTDVSSKALAGKNVSVMVYCAYCREPTAFSKEPVQKLRLASMLDPQVEQHSEFQGQIPRQRRNLLKHYDWKHELRHKIKNKNKNSSEDGRSDNVAEEERIDELRQIIRSGSDSLLQYLGIHQPNNNTSDDTPDPADVLLANLSSNVLLLLPKRLCVNAYNRLIQLQEVERYTNNSNIVCNIPPFNNSTEALTGRHIMVALATRNKHSFAVTYTPLRPMLSASRTFIWGGGFGRTCYNKPSRKFAYWQSRVSGTDLMPFCTGKLDDAAFLQAAKTLEQFAQKLYGPLPPGIIPPISYKSVETVLNNWTQRIPLEEQEVEAKNTPAPAPRRRGRGRGRATHAGSILYHYPTQSQELVVIHTDETGNQVVCGTSDEDRIPLCVCRKSYMIDSSPMLACSSCDEWFHFHCMGLREATREEVVENGEEYDGKEWYFHDATGLVIDARDDFFCPWCEPRMAPWTGLYSLWDYRGDDVFLPETPGITDLESLSFAANVARKIIHLPPLHSNEELNHQQHLEGEDEKSMDNLHDNKTQHRSLVDPVAYAAAEMAARAPAALARRYNPQTGGFFVSKHNKLVHSKYDIGGAGGVFGTSYHVPPQRVWEKMLQVPVKKQLQAKARDFWMEKRALFDQQVLEESMRNSSEQQTMLPGDDSNRRTTRSQLEEVESTQTSQRPEISAKPYETIGHYETSAECEDDNRLGRRSKRQAAAAAKEWLQLTSKGDDLPKGRARASITPIPKRTMSTKKQRLESVSPSTVATTATTATTTSTATSIDKVIDLSNGNLDTTENSSVKRQKYTIRDAFSQSQQGTQTVSVNNSESNILIKSQPNISTTSHLDESSSNFYTNSETVVQKDTHGDTIESIQDSNQTESSTPNHVRRSRRLANV